MTTCLRDRDLILLAAGENSPQQAAHVAHCLVCAERYQRFAHNLMVIEQTLRDTSPPTARVLFPVLFSRPWLPRIAALATVVVLIWSGLWLWSSQRQAALVAQYNQEKVEQFWDEVLAPALFAEPDTRIFVAQSPPSNATYLQAALDGGWPCDWQANPGLPSCAAHPFPFAFDEQQQEVYYVSAD